MPTVRRILSHVHAEIAGGTRRCRRNQKHSILRGEPCLVIQDAGTPYSRSYCDACALAILKQCGAELRSIRDVLYDTKTQAHLAANAKESSSPERIKDTVGTSCPYNYRRVARPKEST